MMKNNLTVQNINGELVVSSRQVAEDFGKEHNKVIRSIENLLDGIEAKSGLYFIETEYKASNGKANKEYLLTRDGFSLIVMGFTGAKALQWKLKYIEAFNKMEQALKSQQPKVPTSYKEALLALVASEEEKERLEKEI